MGAGSCKSTMIEISVLQESLRPASHFCARLAAIMGLGMVAARRTRPCQG